MEVLNSNAAPLVVESVHIQVHGAPLPGGEAAALPQHAVANTTVRPFRYATVLHIAFAADRPGNFSGVLTLHLNGTPPLVVPYAYSCPSPRGLTPSVVPGAVRAESPLFYCLKPSARSNLVAIPLRLQNDFPVPVAVTRVGVAAAAAPFVSVSDRRAPALPAGNRSVACAAGARARFSPLFVLFQAARYRPRMWGCGAPASVGSARCSARRCGSTRTSPRCRWTWWSTTGSSRRTSRTTCWPRRRRWERLARRLVDGESINWGTRLAPVLSATSLLSLSLDMGYVHPDDHRYQTVVLYNRNPVSVEATIRSSSLPHVSFYPIFRAQLTNQTASEASLPNCRR